MAMNEHTPILFKNRDGLHLSGILSIPAASRRTDLAVILLSPGIKMRVGPERLYRRMADEFLRAGLTVFRFDFMGLGDSEGALSEQSMKDVYNHIEVGRSVHDSLDAMDWLQRRCGIRRFVLSGLCGGAVTGLLAGSRDARVAGLIGLGITPLLASRAADPSVYMTTGQLTDMRGRYFRKMLAPKAWLRLLTMKSDYKVLWHAVTAPLRGKKAPAPLAAAATPVATDNTNPLFAPAFFGMMQAKRPVLLIFGGSDRLHWEFKEKFEDRETERLGAFKALYNVHVIPQANHVLSFDEWQRQMLTLSIEWMARHFSTDGASGARQPDTTLAEIA